VEENGLGPFQRNILTTDWQTIKLGNSP